MKKSIFQLAAIPIIIGMLIINCLLPTISQAQYSNLHTFTGYVNGDGGSPYGSLLSIGSNLYGMTAYNGTNNLGTIFKVTTSGTYTTIFNFAGGTTCGEVPLGSLIYDGTYLYGMTDGGGSSTVCAGGCGTIFKIKPDGTNYSIIYNFANNTTSGSEPSGDLIYDGTTTYLYGMTYGGGAHSLGTVFKIQSNGLNYSDLHDFAGGTSDGSMPEGSLLADNTFANLYGMTSGGGSSTVCSGGCGTIFKITPSATYTTIFNFAGGTSGGSEPLGSLIADGTFANLYGMTYGGGSSTVCSGGCGTIFKITPSATYTTIFNFAGGTTCGSHPYGDLIFNGTATLLYGMTEGGGAYNEGTIFSITSSGTNYNDRLDFDATNGSHPYGSLITDGTYFYGMEHDGGTNDDGTILQYGYCAPLTISDGTNYNGSTWSSNKYTTITIGTITTNTITATRAQDFKFSSNTTVNGPFSSSTYTLSIVPTPCP